jgi:hypothetical protein
MASIVRKFNPRLNRCIKVIFHRSDCYKKIKKHHNDPALLNFCEIRTRDKTNFSSIYQIYLIEFYFFKENLKYATEI